MVNRRRPAPFLARIAFIVCGAALAQCAPALEGALRAEHGHFGVVGAFAPNRSSLGMGFSGVHVAPRWVLTAAHVAPPAGAIFVDDCGMAGVAEVITFQFRVPTQTPLTGALRDDLALVRLAAPIDCPYFPRLAAETALAGEGPPFAMPREHPGATLVSKGNSIAARQFAGARIEGVYRTPGYDFVVVSGRGVQLVSGDSGSPLFLGDLQNTDRASVLAGIASGQTRTSTGLSLGVYTRLGRYRPLLDAAVQASGEQLNWFSGADASLRFSRDVGSQGTR